MRKSPPHRLRLLAEERSREYPTKLPDNLDARSREEMQQLLHELRVHQVELEMQQEELRRSQAELEVSRLLYMNLYDQAPVGYVSISESGLILQANVTAATLLGAPRNEIVRQPISRFILQEDREIFHLLRRQLFETGATQECELRMVTLDGTGFWARMEVSAMQDAGGRPVCHVVLIDITAPKRDEQSLRLKSLVFEASLIANSTAGPNGLITEANATFLRIWGYSNKDEVLGKPIAHFLNDQNEAVGILTALDHLDHWEGEYTAKRRDASTFIAHGLATVLRDESGKVIGYQSSVVDITEQKQADEALRQSEEMLRQALHEKESLLKEIHHRVKNNLQIINSLLRMQSCQIDHPIAKAALQDVLHRVQSIALIHEHLYHSDNLAQINLASYLKELCQQLSRALVLTPGTVSLHLDLAPVQLKIDQAIPCGLLVNELVSNAFKYAFPGGRGGQVRVELQHIADGQEIRLRVADNGVGLPPNLDLKQLSTLGLRLVPDLVRQLGGRLEIGTGTGAFFEVVFTRSDG